MKKQISVMAAVCMITGAVNGIVPASAEVQANAFNEFITYSFEDGNISRMGGQNGPVISVEDNSGFLETKGLKLDVSGVTNQVAGIKINNCNAVGNSEYKLSAKVKFANAPTGKLSWRLYNWDAGNSDMKYLPCDYIPIGDGWYSVESTNLYPGNTSSSLMLDIRLNESQIVGSENPVYIDDVELIPVKADVNYGQQEVLEWNAGDTGILTFGNFNNGSYTVDDTGVRVNSKSYNHGVIVNGINKGVTIAEGYNYQIEMTVKLESGSFREKLQLPYSVNNPVCELIDETENLYKITSAPFAYSNVSGQLDKNRFFWACSNDGEETTVLIKQIKVTNLGKTFAPDLQEINTYAYTIDSNNEFAYGIVDKEFTVETENGETSTVTRAVVQQYTLDGTATDKYFDIATIDERYAFSVKYQTNYQLMLTAHDGIVAARPSVGLRQSGEEYIIDTNPVSICLMNFNEDSVTGNVKTYGFSGSGNVFDNKYGFTFMSVGNRLEIYQDSTGYRMGQSYIIPMNDTYSIYTDFDGKNPGKIAVASRCYGNGCKITDQTKIAVIDFDLDNAGRPRLLYNKETPENNSKMRVINLSEELNGVAEYFNPAQMFIEDNKLYVVSKATAFALSGEEALLIFDLSTDTPKFERKIVVSDFDSSSKQTISGIAPCGDYLAVFTTGGRMVLDNFENKLNNLYLIDAENYTWNSVKNPKIELNARAHMTGFTDKYIYSAKAKQDKNANSNKGAIVFESFEKSRKTTAPTIETSGLVNDSAVFNIPELNGSSNVNYQILMSEDNKNWAIVQNGITNEKQITLKLKDKMTGKYLKLNTIYDDQTYSYGTVVTDNRLFGLSVSLPESFDECVKPIVTVNGTAPSDFSNNFKVILAFYKMNENNANELVGSKIFDYNPAAGELIGENAQIPSDADTAMAFLWDNMQSIKPYSQKATVVKTIIEE